MTRVEVTRVVHIVFLLWLVVSIALGLTTIIATPTIARPETWV